MFQVDEGTFIYEPTLQYSSINATVYCQVLVQVFFAFQGKQYYYLNDGLILRHDKMAYHMNVR